MDGIFPLVLIGIVYFFPWFVATVRETSNSGGVFVINLFLGWTLIGWVIALAMAAGGQKKRD